MKAAGASSVTLIFVSGSNEIKEISSYDFETKKPSMTASGYSIPKIAENQWRNQHVYAVQNGAFTILTRNHCSWDTTQENYIENDLTVPAAGNDDQNVKLLGVFDSIWADKANIGKTYRITFKASATLEGKLDLSMTTNGDAYNATISTNYHWKPFPDFNTSVNLTPLFMLDMWEHAFYLDYLNVKADYVKAVWNIANWQDVSERLADAVAKAQGLIVR